MPVFSFQGEIYAAYCGENPIAAGPVVHYSLEDGPMMSFINLTPMALTMAELFESGAVVWNADTESMVEDIKAVANIHIGYNPGSTFPYYVE